MFDSKEIGVDTHLEFISLAFICGKVQSALSFVVPHLPVGRAAVATACWVHKQIDDTMQDVALRIGLESVLGVLYEWVQNRPFELVEVAKDPQ